MLVRESAATNPPLPSPALGPLSNSPLARRRMADDVLLAGVRSVTDLMVNPGLINLDFADVQVMTPSRGCRLASCQDHHGAVRCQPGQCPAAPPRLTPPVSATKSLPPLGFVGARLRSDGSGKDCERRAADLG